MSAPSHVTLSSKQIWAIRLVWLTLAALLAFYWAKFAYNAYLAAIFPGEIDYAEGIVWQQAALIPGPRMYGNLQVYPFLPFNYPPIYHFVVHGLASLGVPWLTAGRLVSTVSTCALAVLAGAFVIETARDAHAIPYQRAALASALVAGLLLVTLPPIQIWAYTMRVDMLEVALDFLGMYLGLISLRRPSFAYVAAFVFVLAAYTKQTAVAGAAATFAVLLLHTRVRALRAALFAILAGALSFAVFTIATDGEFPKHMILYNMNHYSLRDAYHRFLSTQILIVSPVYLGTVIVTAAMLIFRQLGRPLREMQAGYAIALLYFVLSTVSLISLGKAGANSNYLIPWVCSWALLIGLALVDAWKMAERKARPATLLALLAVLILQTFATPKFGNWRVVDPEYRRQYTELIAQTRRATKPVYSEDMVLLMLAGKEVPWEPATITDLSRTGVFDERKVISMIEAHAFAFAIVTTGESDRYSPAVIAAFTRAYPVELRLAGMRVLSPKEGN